MPLEKACHGLGCRCTALVKAHIIPAGFGRLIKGPGPNMQMSLQAAGPAKQQLGEFDNEILCEPVTTNLVFLMLTQSRWRGYFLRWLSEPVIVSKCRTLTAKNFVSLCLLCCGERQLVRGKASGLYSLVRIETALEIFCSERRYCYRYRSFR